MAYLCKHTMFCFILLSFAVTTVVSERPSLVAYSKSSAKTEIIGVHPTVENADENMETFQRVNKEILELKTLFQVKEQAMDKKMEKVQAELDFQKKKMVLMENEIDILKETIGSQRQMIDYLRSSKADVENELMAKICQQKGEIKILKTKTENLENTVSKMKITLDELDEHSQGKTFNEMQVVDNVVAIGVNETFGNKQSLTRRDNEKVSKQETDQPIHNSEVKLSRKSVAETRTKRQITGGIAFSAYLSHDILHLALGHTIKCDQIIINDGNAYSQYTGVFTVPVTGVYLLTFNFDVWNVHRFEWIKLVVNNRNIVDATADGFKGSNMSGNTAILKLTQGENVWLESYYSADGEVLSATYGKLTTFSGVLLYS